jgi:hemerythrin-like metal-binding protein
MAIDRIAADLLGHAELDDDHQRLVDHLNSLANEIPDASYELCVQLFDALEQAATEHFAREEEILEGAGFPGLQSHRAYHAELIERIRRLRNLGWEMADKKLLFQRFVDMANFVVEDIIHGDMEFKEFLAAR